MTTLIEHCYEETMDNLASDLKWLNAKYENIKNASTTAKGNFGQDFTTMLLNQLGYPAVVVNGGIGDYDIVLTKLGITFEHKLATLDTNNCFQFNAIDKDKEYDYVFCLGVHPNELSFCIVDKDEVSYLTTRMTKAHGGFKMTKPAHKLMRVTEENLKNAIDALEKKAKG